MMQYLIFSVSDMCIVYRPELFDPLQPVDFLDLTHFPAEIQDPSSLILLTFHHSFPRSRIPLLTIMKPSTVM